jgi:hypothetical protein
MRLRAHTTCRSAPRDPSIMRQSGQIGTRAKLRYTRQILCGAFQPSGAKSGRFRASSSKTDKTAPGGGATRRSVVEARRTGTSGGRYVLKSQRGEHDEQ